MKVSHLLDVFTRPTVVLLKERDGPWTVRLVTMNRILGFRLKRLGPEFVAAADAAEFYQKILEDKKST